MIFLHSKNIPLLLGFILLGSMPSCSPPGERLMTAILADDNRELESLLSQYPARANDPVKPHRAGFPTNLVGLAAVQGNHQAIQMLAKVGANLSFTNRIGFTPIILAARRGHVQCVRALLDLGVSVRSQTPDGYSLLMAGAAYPDIVALLLARGANPNVISTGTYDIMAKHGLLERQIEKSDTGPGQSALQLAVAHSGYASTLLLLHHAANPDQPDWLERTPLMIACTGGELDLVKMLINHHANIEVRDSRGRSALDIARQCGYSNIVAYLQTRLRQ